MACGRMTVVTAVALWIGCFGGGIGVAEAQSPAPAPTPSLPGMIITPDRSIGGASPQNEAPSTGDSNPHGRKLRGDQPRVRPFGGCQYEHQPLELIV